MYCSSCGVAVTQGLGYCNYCGAKLNGANGDSVSTTSEVKPEMLVGAMVTLFVLGLVAIAILTGVMKSVLNLDAGQILGFAALSFLIMLLIEGVFILLLLRRPRGAEETSKSLPSKNQTTNELNAAQERALPEPSLSVTDHTTRAFDPIYSERKSK
jgi:hypothetical protein